MAGPVEFVKRHPIATGAGVITIAAVLLLASSGGGGGGGQVQTGPSSEQIAASTQLSMAQLEAQTVQQQASAQQVVALSEISAQDRATTLAAQLETHRLNVASVVNLREIDSQLESSLAGTEANRQIQLGSQAAAVTQAQIDAGTQRYVADKQYKASKKASSASTFGSILGFAGSLLGFFSDARLKENISYAGTDAYGVRWYKFRYNAYARRAFGYDARIREGVLAHELLHTPFAQAVSVDRGYYVVDYARLQQMTNRRMYA